MRLLVVGGCGLVGSLVVPVLARTHSVRVLDLAAPAAPMSDVDYHTGDLHDVDLVESLASEVDTVVFMAMGPLADWGSPENARAHFDVAVSGLYLTLLGARRAGVRHAIYTSSMSVYRFEGRPGTFTLPDESVPPNATDFYGLAKRLGEEVCRAATEHGMDTVCLRLCYPTPDDQWPKSEKPMQLAISTSGRDVAAAIEAALHYRGHGFEAFAISGDATGKALSIDKARRLLGWTPRDVT